MFGAMSEPPALATDMAVFLDFDGTLVEIAPSPEMVRPEPCLVPLLIRRLDDLNGALGIVSGRPLAEIDRLLDPLRFPGAGLHGLEYRTSSDAAIERIDIGSEITVLRGRLAASGLTGAGLQIEDKGSALAVHYRRVPELGMALREHMEAAIDDLPDLHLIDGKMVVEAKPRLSDKGKMVEAFMRFPPFAGRVPVFIGDDTTDEDGMRAAAALGGFGIKVGSGASVGTYRLQDVAAVHRWLAAGVCPETQKGKR